MAKEQNLKLRQALMSLDYSINDARKCVWFKDPSMFTAEAMESKQASLTDALQKAELMTKLIKNLMSSLKQTSSATA